MEKKKVNLTKKKNKGFSLVELMVVVAIIGVLATIAVPQLNQWVAKARQAEAKSSLSGLYTAMKGFFAEHQRYFGNFNTIGLQPEGQLRYSYGFVSGSNLGSIDSSVTPTANTDFNTSLTTVCDSTLPCTVLETRTFKATSFWSLSTFVAGAQGDLDGDDAIDRWTINNNKSVSAVYDDLSNETVEGGG